MASGNVPREIYIGAILVFYLAFGLIYAAIGNNINELTGASTPSTINASYSNPAIQEESHGLFSFVINGIEGYSDTPGLEWVNYIFGFMSFIFAVMIIVLLLHG